MQTHIVCHAEPDPDAINVMAVCRSDKDGVGEKTVGKKGKHDFKTLQTLCNMSPFGKMILEKFGNPCRQMDNVKVNLAPV